MNRVMSHAIWISACRAS
jgi:hypothetical protein